MINMIVMQVEDKYAVPSGSKDASSKDTGSKDASSKDTINMIETL